jgi:hypothetical protein
MPRPQQIPLQSEKALLLQKSTDDEKEKLISQAHDEIRIKQNQQ